MGFMEEATGGHGIAESLNTTNRKGFVKPITILIKYELGINLLAIARFLAKSVD